MEREKSSGREHCIKCLLQDFDQEAYMGTIRRVILLMKASERASEEENARRLSICRSCDFLDKGTCRACGCFVELRAAARYGKCPYKKWNRQAHL